MKTQFTNTNTGNRTINKIVWFENGKEYSDQSEFAYNDESRYTDEFNLWKTSPPIHADKVDNKEYEVRQFVKGVKAPVAVYNNKTGDTIYIDHVDDIKKQELIMGC